MVPITDHVYIVTGGGGAIAGAVNVELRKAGARLAIVDRTQAHAQRGVELAGGFAIAADLSTHEGAEDMVKRTVDHFGRVDGLVHTVGGFEMGGVAGSEPALYERMFDLNVRTLLMAVRAVLPNLMAQNEGLICGFSSEPGLTGRSSGSALYGAAKSAVATLLHSLDGELAGSDVRVAVVYPMGAVDTPHNRREMPHADPSHFIDPQAIGEAIVFAATRGPRGRMIDFPVHPARQHHYAR